MIAGPNGVGKTTTAIPLITHSTIIYEFINADEIARGLAPLHPESVSLAASKLMIKRFQELLKANNSFAFETTAAGKNYIKYLKEAEMAGYEIHLMFLWLSSPDLAVKRVAQRVERGGHHVPEATIRRRYYVGLRNLIKYYLPLANSALILDNLRELINEMIAQKNVKDSLQIKDKKIWKRIQRTANEKIEQD